MYYTQLMCISKGDDDISWMKETIYRLLLIISLHSLAYILEVVLKSDIMTPHYAPYYTNQNGGTNSPGDWYSPTPIPFLTVDKDQPFLFAIMPRPGVQVGPDLNRAWKWLCQALEWLGAGATKHNFLLIYIKTRRKIRIYLELVPKDK